MQLKICPADNCMLQQFVDMHQIMVIDAIMHVPVAKHHRVPTVHTVQRIVNISQMVYVDKTVDVHVGKNGHVPNVQKLQRPVECPQMDYIDNAQQAQRKVGR